MVYSAKHREYQLVVKSTVPCFFLNRVIFTMSFDTVVCPRSAPGIGGLNANLGEARLKKFCAGDCAP